MSAAPTTRLQVNFKTPRGTLINLYADTPEQLDAELDAVTERIGTIRDLEDSFGAAAALPQGSVQVPPTAPAWGGGASAPAAAPTAAPQGPDAGAAPACPHGTRTFKTGQGKRGPWSAWMCPAPKGTPGQCDPQWLN